LADDGSPSSLVLASSRLSAAASLQSELPWFAVRAEKRLPCVACRTPWARSPMETCIAKLASRAPVTAVVLWLNRLSDARFCHRMHAINCVLPYLAPSLTRCLHACCHTPLGVLVQVSGSTSGRKKDGERKAPWLRSFPVLSCHCGWIRICLLCVPQIVLCELYLRTAFCVQHVLFSSCSSSNLESHLLLNAASASAALGQPTLAEGSQDGGAADVDGEDGALRQLTQLQQSSMITRTYNLRWWGRHGRLGRKRTDAWR